MTTLAQTVDVTVSLIIRASTQEEMHVYH